MLITLITGVGVRSLGPLTPEIGALTFFGPRVPALETIALAIHYGFEPLSACILTAGVCLVLLLVYRDVLRALAFGSITAVGWVAAEVGKYTIFRPRPPHGIVHSVIIETANDSFPSGHTSFVFSLVCAVVLVLTRPGAKRPLMIAAGTVLVATVAFSRIYLGLHYPSDVIGSILISTAALFIWLPIWNRYIHPTFLRITFPPSLFTPTPRG
ncbi:phosphatase PAP2 family protein [Frigoribacterium sp. CG_9.8]|uniref:phosphatase PAP2 family protein n=1 Tax=Frigoribacterium sp. CG_9.8 TaxID=2787733 RepID=UPI0018CBBD80|nr:phosphatase PAP2 family protein [Frigoribacterium sp. CG_9.8]MBG6108627.1 undecaprenyl-diphosphatase [Frigoribacterium sp. CG_9.8]